MSNRMIPFEEALRIIDESVYPLDLIAETLAVKRVLGRRLAEDAISTLDVPLFNRSAVDGFALPDNLGGDYEIIGTLPAGRAWVRPLEKGECLKIMTGAPVPDGAAMIVMLEDVLATGSTITVDPSKLNDKINISPSGEDLQAGGVALKKGAQIGAAEIGLLISCGVCEVKVYPKLRAAIVSTGAEIVSDVSKISPGKIMNSNGPMLTALCGENGLEVVSEITVGDGLAEAEASVKAALEASDVVLISGGVSAGEFDCVPDALSNLGLDIPFRRVAVKPGKPSTFATGDRKVVFGLPGNPVAVYLMFHLMVLRAAARMQGASLQLQIVTSAIGRDYTRSSAARAEFVPASGGANGYFYPAEYHGSAHLAAAVSADGFIFVPAGVSHIAAGSDVQICFFGGRKK